ncbi:hypothetical protein BJ508DRAFT_310198 [Ascobolus immersus RN42]|uniref:F-box domain-containing protein n=1 Tax=Ascobolus immersus RN42 TaxID=1160509 RepID=A0A3N4HU89_ASCIM|nr:hypothetical protein BJ508DRAFT_310198 [Ascobolus immersus RN42]
MLSKRLKSSTSTSKTFSDLQPLMKMRVPSTHNKYHFGSHLSNRFGPSRKRKRSPQEHCEITEAPINKLPNELLHLVAKNVEDTDTFLALSLVSRRFNAVTGSALTQSYFARRWMQQNLGVQDNKAPKVIESVVRLARRYCTAPEGCTCLDSNLFYNDKLHLAAALARAMPSYSNSWRKGYLEKRRKRAGNTGNLLAKSRLGVEDVRLAEILVEEWQWCEVLEQMELQPEVGPKVVRIGLEFLLYSGFEEVEKSSICQCGALADEVT